MPSERSQILALFAAGRIDLTEAERLLCLVVGRDRFLTSPYGVCFLRNWRGATCRTAS